MNINDLPISFEISGHKFKGQYLSPEKSLDAFAIIGPAISTILDNLDPKLLKAESDTESKQVAMATAIGKGLTTFRDLPRVRPFFISNYYCEVDGNWPRIDSFEEDLFKGKAILMVSFLVAAIKAEYGDFLLAHKSSMLKDLAKIFGFRLISKDTGQSGESSATTESKEA